jgi:hypothetical protein
MKCFSTKNSLFTLLISDIVLATVKQCSVWTFGTNKITVLMCLINRGIGIVETNI